MTKRFVKSLFLTKVPNWNQVCLCIHLRKRNAAERKFLPTCDKARPFDKGVLLTNPCVIKNHCAAREVVFYAVFACIRVERSSALLSPRLSPCTAPPKKNALRNFSTVFVVGCPNRQADGAKTRLIRLRHVRRKVSPLA